MQPTTPIFTGMETTFRDTCALAMQCGHPFPSMLRLYRSVVGLTRVLMQARVNAGLDAGLSDELVALLEKIRDTVGLHFSCRDLPLDDAIRLQTITIALARTAHRARFGQVAHRRPRARPAPAEAVQTAAPEPVRRPLEIAAPDDDTLPDTPASLDLRTKVLNGDPVRDFMSRRFGPNDDVDAAYAEAQRQSAVLAKATAMADRQRLATGRA